MAKNFNSWLAKAVFKDKSEERPELAQVTEGWASDRYRIHRLAGAPVPMCHAVWANAAAWLEKAKAGPTKVAVSGEHFKDALKAARVFHGDVTIHFGDICQVGAINPALGDVRTDLMDGNEVAYSRIGPDVLAHFNVKYLLDALAGMGKKLTMALHVLEYVEEGPVYVVYVTSENGNEAVVCGVISKAKLPRFEGDPPEPPPPPVGDDGYCKECGREYGDEVRNAACPSDDCPSNKQHGLGGACGDAEFCSRYCDKGCIAEAADEYAEPTDPGSDWVPDPVVHDLPEAV